MAGDGDPGHGASGWGRLTTFLRASSEPEVRLRWHEIERIIGQDLPASKVNPAFWSNSSYHANAWVAAGFRSTRAGCLPDELRFVRVGGTADPEREAATTRVGAQLPSPEVQAAGGHYSVGTPAGVVLVGCVKEKRDAPAPAADLYVSTLFAGRRRYAEASGRRWFILSAEHGLVRPQEWLSPYDRYLPDQPDWYRWAWGEWCTARLASLVGPLHGTTVEIHAGRAYVDAITPSLTRFGARVELPLAHLRMGEQLAWYAGPPRQTAEGAPAAPQTTGTAAIVPALPSDPRQAVVQALVAYRAQHLDPRGDRPPLSGDPEADALVYADPFAFLVAVILDEGIVAERAWRGPAELARRLGHLDPWRLREEPAAVRVAVAAPPALHRYVDTMGHAIVDAARRVCADYGGDASLIWAPGSSTRDVDARLQQFQRIGQKKAAMAVEILISHFGIALADLTGTDVAYDVHLRRVFLRTGLAERDDPDHMVAVARQLYPERPGYLDFAAWAIGRRWCRPRDPDCAGCPLGSVCPRLVDRSAQSRIARLSGGPGHADVRGRGVGRA